MSNRFEQHPKLTLFLFTTLLLVVLLIGFEKVLGTRLTGGNSAEVVRHIRLREHSPFLSQSLRPDANVLANSDGLENREYTFTTDKDGYIMPSLIHSNPDATIAFIGGSTTESMFVTVEKRFPYLSGKLLENKTSLAINTLNSGVSGNDSLHSIDLFLNKIIANKPDIAVLMHNVNDLSVLLYEKTYWNNNDYRSPLIEEDRSLKSFIKQLLPNTYELLYRLKTSLAGQVDEFDKVRGQKLVPDKDKILDQFGANLTIFVNIAKARHITPVLMTQANRFTQNPKETVQKSLSALNSLGVSYEEYRALYQAMNEKVRTVASDNNVLLIDLAKHIPQTSEYIYDPVHLNTKGSIKAAQIISEHLQKILPVKK